MGPSSPDGLKTDQEHCKRKRKSPLNVLIPAAAR